MAPCRICQSIDLADVFKKSINESFTFDETYPLNHNLFMCSTPNHGFQHPVDGLVLYHKSLESLRISAGSCELCHLVQDQVDEYLRNSEVAAKLGFKYAKAFELWICGTRLPGVFQVLGYNEASAEDRFVKSASYEFLAGFGICVDDSSILANMAQGRKISSSARSPIFLHKIKEWMVATTAIPPIFPYMPKRLLRIVNNGASVQLVYPMAAAHQYACLSHCWGLTQHLTLSSCTAEKLEAGISTTELPRNFQDAIWFTHQMGLLYLWIDSLCIVQDDVQDWSRESAQMDKVYYNAAIVIAASQANDSSEGFLDRKLQRTYTPISITLGGVRGEVLLYSVPLRLAGDPTRLVEMEDEPLTARGWALQERYMARRTVHFTQGQVLLEGEGELLAEDSGFAVGLPTRSPFTLRSSTGQNLAWAQVVERYSRRKLTRAQDKLPALAGLAAYFSSVYENETPYQEQRYLAGLWSSDLVKDLCWQIPYRHSPQARPKEYRAPTWSWASVDGPVVCRETFSKNLLMVRDAQVELKSLNNIFGQVTGGWISLSAILLKPYAISADGHCFQLTEKGNPFFLVDTRWDTEICLTNEEVQVSITEEKFVVVPVAWKETIGPLELAGPLCLILTPVEQTGHSIEGTPTYKRVGSGIARPGHDDNLVKVIIPTWTNAFERGDLVEIVVV